MAIVFIGVGIVVTTIVMAVYPLMQRKWHYKESLAAAAVYNLSQKAGTQVQLMGLSVQDESSTGTSRAASVGMVKTGRLKGGTAVYYERSDSAFWVSKEGSVFTVNESARKLLPAQTSPPPKITYKGVVDAVR